MKASVWCTITVVVTIKCCMYFISVSTMCSASLLFYSIRYAAYLPGWVISSSSLVIYLVYFVNTISIKNELLFLRAYWWGWHIAKFLFWAKICHLDQKLAKCSLWSFKRYKWCVSYKRFSWWHTCPWFLSLKQLIHRNKEIATLRYDSSYNLGIHHKHFSSFRKKCSSDRQSGTKCAYTHTMNQELKCENMRPPNSKLKMWYRILGRKMIL